MDTLIFVAEIVGVITIGALAAFGLVTLVLVVRDEIWAGPGAAHVAERHSKMPRHHWKNGDDEEQRRGLG